MDPAISRTMTGATLQALVGTMGMFIIDTFRYLDPVTGNDHGDGGRGEQLGGGGLYFAIGARMWLQPEQIAMVIDKGVDFQDSYTRALDSYAVRHGSEVPRGMWVWRKRTDAKTTKAVNVYKGENRG